jgi:hypothetical protein
MKSIDFMDRERKGVFISLHFIPGTWELKEKR